MNETKPSGYRKKSAARLAAVQVLYTKKMLDLSEKEALDNFHTHFLGKNLDESLAIKPDLSFLNILVKGVCAQEEKLLGLIAPHLSETWKIERIDSILMNILKCATFELISFPDVDAPIIVSEYLDVTHAFFDQKEVGFANAILNQISKAVRL